MANTTDDPEIIFNGTGTQTRTRNGSAFYYSLSLVWIPGIIFNIIALSFIIKDMRKTTFPALVLLFLLCIFDTLDICGTAIYLAIGMFVKITDIICGTVTFFFNFFAVAAGATNSFLAIDRVIAIGHPFYYKSKFTKRTWIKICLIAGAINSIFCLFPMIGLGDMWTRYGSVKRCSLGYREDPVKRIFGMMFSSFEIIYIITLIVCNGILIKDLMKMNKKFVVPMPSTTGPPAGPEAEATITSKNEVSSIEVVFAKLMIALSCAYLIFGTPARVGVLVKQLRVNIPNEAVGVINSLNGYLRVINPIIYILIRKVDRKKVFHAICRCFKRRD